MALMRFSLDRIAAFKNKNQGATARHFCIHCACEAKDEYTLIPFLHDQLEPTLSDFGQEMGAIMLCDKCGEVIATYYPDTFWQGPKTDRQDDHHSLLHKQF